MNRQGLPPGPSVPATAQALLWGLHYPSFTQRAHRKYGPTFTVHVGRLTPSVVTVDREGIRRLLTGDPMTRRHASDQLKPLFGERSIVLLESAEHLERRKLLLPAFHGAAVQAYGEAIEGLTEAAIACWRPGDVVEILPIAQRLTLDVILQLLVGGSDSDTGRRVREIFDSMVGLPGSAIAGYFPRLGRRTRWNFMAERYWRLRDSLDVTLMANVEALNALPDDSDVDALVPLMVRLKADGGHGLSDADLRDDLKALVMAGNEPSATAITWGAELLAHNPGVQTIAREAAIAGESEYLDALVKEILRIRPPIPVAADRRVTVPFELTGFTIPPGVPLLVNAYGLHHDPMLFPDPERFAVERFIGTGPAAYSFLPFGGGTRRCIGSSLAQLEIRIVLATLLKRFALEPTSDRLARTVRRGITLVPANGARVRLASLERRGRTPLPSVGARHGME